MTHDYQQIVQTPPNGCDGPGLRNLLIAVLEVVPAKFVSVSDVDLVGDARLELLVAPDEVRVLSVVELLAHLENCTQIVWANIFLCQTEAQSRSLLATEDYIDCLTKAEALVRVVDAEAYYVYGPAGPMTALHQHVGGAALVGKLEDLEFPE